MGFKLVTRVGVGTRNPKVLAALAAGFLRGVVACNRIIIRECKAKGHPLPELYRSGVRYEREPWTTHEEFADALTVLSRGWGDCDDLCAWRVAELLEKGEQANVRIYWRPKRQGNRMMHCQVRRGNGDIEDPSRFLGL